MRIYGVRRDEREAFLGGLPVKLNVQLTGSHEPMAEGWIAPEVTIDRIDRHTGRRLREGDLFVCNSRHLAFSARAVRAVGPSIMHDGELLPIRVDRLEAFLFHPLGAESVVDLERTVVEHGGNESALSAVRRDRWIWCRPVQVAFHAELTTRRAIFPSLGFGSWAGFVTDVFVDEVRGAGLRGLVFDLVWEDDSPSLPVGPPQIATPATTPPGFTTDLPPVYETLVDGASVLNEALDWTAESPGASPSTWRGVDGPIEFGGPGIHLVAGDPYLTWPTWNMRAYEAEAESPAIVAHGRVVTSRARLVREIEPPAWWQAGCRFIEQELPRVPWFTPTGPARDDWVVFAGDGEWVDIVGAAIDAADADPRGPAMWQIEFGQLRHIAANAGRREPADVQWGTAWITAKLAIEHDVLNAPSGDLVASSVDVADHAANMCLLRGVLSDIEVPDLVRTYLESCWDAYTRGYVPVYLVDGRVYVVHRTPETGTS